MELFTNYHFMIKARERKRETQRDPCSEGERFLSSPQHAFKMITKRVVFFLHTIIRVLADACRPTGGILYWNINKATHSMNVSYSLFLYPCGDTHETVSMIVP